MNALLRIVGWVLAVALVVLPVVAVLNGWVGANHWPLTRLQATGEFHRVDGALLRQTLAPYAQRGFFAVDLDAAQDAVAKLPANDSTFTSGRWATLRRISSMRSSSVNMPLGLAGLCIVATITDPNSALACSITSR